MDMDKYIGRLLDNRYEILEVIGVGGMAVVYKARCHRLNRLVAIKILKDDYSQDEEFRRRFHAESQAVAMLSHSNIVSVYDVSTSDDADYIVMELIDGITLKQYMEKKGVLNWKETLHFAIQISKALEHAHSRGIIHRDIKPHNVMVLKNGSVKVADFGIARVMSKSNTLTKEALGSVHYISPEQAKGGRVDSRSDIYSLGVVMYEMMTGRPPYDGESPVAVAIQHINGKASMPSTLNPNMPGGLEQIIMKAMEQEPTKRYTTATEMLYDMDEFRKDPSILFDYNNTSTGIDDATLLQRPEQPKEPEVNKQPVKTAAERTVSKASGAKAVNKVPARRAAGTSPQNARRRQKEEIIEENDSRSWVATVAIILCALVAVAAIGIFIYVLLGTDTGPRLVEVPNLIGKKLNSSYVASIKDLTFREEKVYSEQYAVDQIVEQNPTAGTRVQQGTEVTVTVSLGPKPQEMLMEDLVLLEESTALKFLKQSQGIAEDKITVQYEPSDSVEEGFVIRTDPGEGESLSAEQKIILYVSSGKQIRKNKMPNVMYKNIDTAEKVLSYSGFKNIIREEVESTWAKGTVVGQSEAEGEEIPLTTVIILQVAKGEELPVTPPEAPTEPDETLDTKVVTIEMPKDMEQPYTVSVRKDGQLLAQLDVPAETLRVEVELRGKGTETFELWIDNTPLRTFQVDFDAAGDDPVIEDDLTNE